MFKKLVIFVILLALVPCLCGCFVLLAGAAGGAGTAAWLSNKLTQEVNAPFEKSIEATKSALKSLKLYVEKEIRKDNVAQIMSNYSDGKTIWIDIHRLTTKTSRIEVRVGVAGDEEAARKIMDKILRYL
ncbi:MAG: DUF3568 family protein [Candidatus Omnitrophica bacterium]|nr:DUF3568 family protein [Candidatus Omnitrophota bacterium]